MEILSHPQSTKKSIVEIESHVDLFKCPNSGLACVLMSASQIRELNESIADGKLLHLDGTRVQSRISSALASKSGEFIYPIVDEIVCFLPRLAIARSRDAQHSQHQNAQAAQVLTEFYDEFGWQKSSDGLFCDAAKFEDLRPVSSEYIHNCHMRLNKYITRGGKYLLDIGSGPVQYEEYLSYSNGFAYRICADISIVALQAAKQRLGSKGIYILADITNLPFADESIDCAVSLHTIYHVQGEQQRDAFEELYRVLTPSHSAIVVYTWGHLCWLMKHFNHIAPRVEPLRSDASSPEPAMFFEAHNYEWFSRQTWSFHLQTFVWRSLSVEFMRTCIHESLFGRQVLRFIYQLENLFPRLMGRFGQYPLFLLTKPAHEAPGTAAIPGGSGALS